MGTSIKSIDKPRKNSSGESFKHFFSYFNENF